MQRRAVAVYVAFFLLVGSAAGVLVATAQTPGISFENPDHELSSGDSFEVNGTEYTLAGITETEEGGDHGGEGQRTITATVERNRTTERSASWANGSTVSVDGQEWTVRVSGEDPDSVTLVEVLDRTAILENDPNADNETVERDGEAFVVVTDDAGDPQLVTPEEYFPAPEDRSYAVGDELTYEDRTVTVDSVTADGAVVVWTDTETVTTEITQNSRVTIGDTEYVAHFPDSSSVTLSTDFESFEAQREAIDRHGTNSDGLWRVTIVSLLSSGLLLAMAFMPSRY